MKKGFTLMEVLAVILVLAVVTTLAAPVFRSVRYEIRQAQAKVAAKKLAESLKTYYQASRGRNINTCFQARIDCTPGNNVNSIIKLKPTSSCTDNAPQCLNSTATGIPATFSGGELSADQLFACGFLSAKDFARLPYTFCTSKSAAADLIQNKSCTGAANTPMSWANSSNEYVIAFANEDLNGISAGDKYFKNHCPKGYIYVDRSMEALDTYE